MIFILGLKKIDYRQNFGVHRHFKRKNGIILALINANNWH
jgi:hypothetical protein